MLSSKTIGLLLLYISSVSSIGERFAPIDTTWLVNLSFFEQFLYDSLESSPWLPSSGQTYDEGRDEVVKYTGKWAIEEPHVLPAFERDNGLVMKSKASHHAISRALSEPFNNTNQLLVLQYEVKLQKGLDCGGAYIKLLNKGHNLKYFRSTTPFQIMFGPDRCGANDKVHFIMSRTNPITRETTQKHLVDPPLSKFTDLTSLYTLIIHPNQDYEMRINGLVAKAGNLVSDPYTFDPPLNSPKFVVDENDEMPIDWDDRKYIPDPEKLEPTEEYLTRFANVEIPDPLAKQPESWFEDEEWFIPDLEATKPGTWIDERDGEWQRPQKVNPKCTAPGVAGCGPWNPPTIFNPEYIGPYFPPEIDNPAYMGEWEPRLIPNPEYYEDSRPSDLNDEIGALAFELWGMDAEVLFDNIYFGHSVEEAERLGNTTFMPKYQIEVGLKAKIKPNIKFEPLVPPPDFSALITGKERGTMTELKQFVLQLMKQYKDELESAWARMTLKLSISKPFAMKMPMKPWPEPYYQARAFTSKSLRDVSKDMHSMYVQILLNPFEAFWKQPVKFVAYSCLVSCAISIAFGLGSVAMFVVSTFFLSRITRIEHDRQPIRNGENINIRLFEPDHESPEGAEINMTAAELTEAEVNITTAAELTEGEVISTTSAELTEGDRPVRRKQQMRNDLQ